MRRKSPNVFSLAFVDSMFCGFGAVILLFMIINHDTQARRDELHEDLRGEVARLEQEVVDGRKQLVELKNTLEETNKEQATTEGLAKRIINVVRNSQDELADLDRETLARTEHINALKADLKSLDEETKRLVAGAENVDEVGEKQRSFAGEGDRQYLTGLKVGGERIFIMVDASASMLADSIVNIIRLRNLPDAEKRRSKKWRRTVASTDWISTQIPPTSKFQLYTFNEAASPVVKGTQSTWLDAGDVKTANKSISSLRKIVPGKGTSLYHVFSAAKKMRPAPDNIFLLTDGLPTQGESKPWGSKVSGKQRLKYFNKALKELPAGVPVNIILFPMEGDPAAASAFWKLAEATNGSLISPAEDWP